MRLVRTEMASPIGPLTVVGGEMGLCAIEFAPYRDRTMMRLEKRFGAIDFVSGPMIDEAVAAIESYFAGDIAAIDRIPVDLGGTEFQQKVWARLRRITAGSTTSYGELARALGSPGAMRAVGMANGRNPVPIVVPCHRVIASDGTLGGYGGGLPIKKWLLVHEGARIVFSDQMGLPMH